MVRKDFTTCLKKLIVEVGDNALKGLRREQKLRLRKTTSKVTEKYKKQPQRLHSMRKKTRKSKSYSPEGFSKKSIPDLTFTSQ